MKHDEHTEHGASCAPRRFNWIFVAFLAIAAFYLFTEHRAHLLGALPFLLLLACPLMHLFMHHGHGAHRSMSCGQGMGAMGGDKMGSMGGDHMMGSMGAGQGMGMMPMHQMMEERMGMMQMMMEQMFERQEMLMQDGK